MSGWLNKAIIVFVIILLLGYFLSDRQKEQVKDKIDTVVDIVAEEAPGFFAYANNLLDRFDPSSDRCCEQWPYNCEHSHAAGLNGEWPVTSINDPDFYDPNKVYLDIDVNGK